MRAKSNVRWLWLIARLWDLQFNDFFQFRFICGILFLTHLFSPSKGELMLKAPTVQLMGMWRFIFWFRVHVITFNLIAFIVSIETEASLLALAKSIYIVCLHSISSILDIFYNTYTLFIYIYIYIYNNVVFPAQAEYSYFSADFRLKIFLYYS